MNVQPDAVQLTDKPRWQNVVFKKRHAQADAIDAFISRGHSIRDPTIVDEGNAATLAVRIARGSITAEDVTVAYIARCINIHRKTNCLTEVCFDKALQRARELDRYFAENGTPVGPLHGIPMTLKDQFDVKGWDTTLGYIGRAGIPAADDAVLVQMLQFLGAIIVAKTNLPQSIMWCETENPLWGLTTNPMDDRYTPGGSTGGEAALLSLHGSCVGWGTDIGGSIRIPSHMMGLYGLKPSSARLPYFGVPVSTEGQEHVPSSVGPLARSLSSLQYSMKALTDAQPWLHDARCAPLPWNEGIYKDTLSRALTIGVLLDDSVVRPHPPLTRVLQQTIAKLRIAGHDIFDWDAGLHEDIVAVQDAFYSSDGGEDIRRAIDTGGEPMIPHVAKLVNRGPAISVYEYWQLNRRKWKLQQAYLEKWNTARSPTTGRTADVLIMPPMPHPAVPHGSCRWVGYTKVWNVLDYPALVIPAGHVEAPDVDVPWTYEARNEVDSWNSRLWIENRTDMARLKLPVGIQIIGRKLQEETVLAAGDVMDSLIQERER